MQVFNARTQQLEDVTWSADRNHEVIATFADETFVKFPAGLTPKELQKLVDEHADANDGQEVITPEQEAELEAQAAASQGLVDQLNGNTIPTGDKTNAPTDISNS